MHGLFRLLFPVLLASQVIGHGFVHQVTIAGQSYIGNAPAESMQRGPSVVRQIANTQPVKGANNSFLACGTGAVAATLVADANPGDTVGFDWKGSGLAPWPHVVGPIITYMASCGSVTCDNFDPKNAKWFKISQFAEKSDGLWYMSDVHNGIPINVQIPSTLAAGNYLIRQEIIALHVAMTMGGAEFYPSCTQLRVGGMQTGTPDSSDLVTFPGAYKDSDPGLFVPGIYEPGLKYILPGPPIARIAKGNNIPTSSSPATTTTTTSQTASSTAAPTLDALVVVKPPVSTVSAAPVTAASPVATRICSRKRSLLKYMSETAESAVQATPTPLISPSRSRHFRRRAPGHDSRF